MTPEQQEILRNTRAAYRRFLDGIDDGITLEQLRDVEYIVARDMAEKECLQ